MNENEDDVNLPTKDEKIQYSLNIHYEISTYVNVWI